MRCCDRCLCRNLLVTSAAGANWFNAKFVAPVLPAIIRDHLQFRWGFLTLLSTRALETEV